MDTAVTVLKWLLTAVVVLVNLAAWSDFARSAWRHHAKRASAPPPPRTNDARAPTPTDR